MLWPLEMKLTRHILDVYALIAVFCALCTDTILINGQAGMKMIGAWRQIMPAYRRKREEGILKKR